MEQQSEQLPPLDQNYLRVNYHEAGFSYLLPEILELFSKQLVLNMQAIDQFFQQGNQQGLVAEAHTLKGTAGSVGATALAVAASHLEHQAVSADSCVVQDLVLQVRQAAKRTEDAIIVELARLAAEDDAALDLF